jgi:peroxiredoxin
MDTASVPIPPPLPTGLPEPLDDGMARHLPGARIPDLDLFSTEGKWRNLKEIADGAVVLYVFPKMGRPDEKDPPGWDETPGARGCTQQSCAFRDHRTQFLDFGYAVMGLSAQPSEDQKAAVERLHLAFPLLADPDGLLADALNMPTFEIAGMTLYKRLTLIIRAGHITKAFYPVFPPDENAEEVLEWIRANDADVET